MKGVLTAVKYLKIFVEFEEYIQVLDDGEKGRLFAAMLAYARDGQEPELPGNERFLWPVARQQLKNAAAQYQKVCAANSANARRRAGVPPVSRPTRPLQGLDQSEESQQVPGDLAGVPPVSRPARPSALPWQKAQGSAWSLSWQGGGKAARRAPPVTFGKYRKGFPAR